MESNNVKAAIHAAGHTYESLGEKIGISPQAIAEIVAGRTKGATARYAVAAALGITVDELWPEDSSKAA